MERIVNAACEFQAMASEARLKSSEAFRRSEQSRDVSLRVLIDGQIASLAMLVTRPVAETNAVTSYQLSLSASYIRSHYIITDLLLNGDLLEALVLMRKQLETLARISEVSKIDLSKLEGKVPNVKNVLPLGAGRVYGDLSEVAHFSRPEVGELLDVHKSGELVGPTLLPAFSERSRGCMDLNSYLSINFVAWLTQQVAVWYPKYDVSPDVEALRSMVDLALSTGVIRKVKGQ